MKRSTWLILLTSSVMLLVLGISGFYLRYVKSQMLIGLVLTALLMGLLAVREVRRNSEDKPPRAALLLFVPLAVFLLFPSQNAGPFTEDTPRVAVPNNVGLALPQEKGGVVALPLLEYAGHASYGDPLLEGKKVSVEGFSYTSKDQPQLVRLVMSCCAADSQAVVVDLDRATGLTDYTWVRIEGTYTPSTEDRDGQKVARLAITSVTQIDPPTDPYE